MGEEIPDVFPKTCAEDCCDDLPVSLAMSIEVPGVGTYSGTVTKSNGCVFGGVLTKSPADGTTPGIATFCTNGGNDLILTTAGPILAQCGGVVIENNHCSIPAYKVSAGGCTYSLG